MIGPVTGCDTCSEYAERRFPVLPREIVLTATRRGVNPADLARRYFAAVHERHLAGGSLDTTTTEETTP